jgi:histidyl-tRNA synthetase
MDAEFETLGIPREQRQSVLRLIDRRDKMSPADWQAYAAEIGLSPEQFSGLQSSLANFDLWRKSPELERFFAAIDALGVKDYVRFAPHIIRGLEYYTGTVFEAWDKDGEFRAILGGGRYDNLVGDVGGDPLTGVGFAMGDVVVGLVLKKFGCLPENLGLSPAQVLVTVFDEASQPAALAFASRLRAAGLKVASYPEAAKLSKQFKYGDRMRMRLAAVLGPEEITNGQVALKDLRSGEQITVPQEGVENKVREMLDRSTSS